MILRDLKKMLFFGIFVCLFIFNANSQITVYNNFGEGHDGWDYTHTTGWTISGDSVTQQYGVEQALGFESTSSGVLSDIWLAISYCNPSSLPDTVVLFLCSNPDGLPPDSANIIEKWSLFDFNSWSQWNTPFHLQGDGESNLEEGESYWLWAIGMETTWTMWCINEDPALTCPHTIRREGEDWLNVSYESASAFRIDVIDNVGISSPEASFADGNVLSQNYPNPFSGSTTISYTIEKPNNVKLIVCNAYGKEVQPLVDAFQSAGEYTIDFDPNQLPTGIYFYKFLVGNKLVDVKRMLYSK